MRKTVYDDFPGNRRHNHEQTPIETDPRMGANSKKGTPRESCGGATRDIHGRLGGDSAANEEAVTRRRLGRRSEAAAPEEEEE